MSKKRQMMVWYSKKAKGCALAIDWPFSFPKATAEIERLLRLDPGDFYPGVIELI